MHRNDRCADCEYWKMLRDGEGECLRYPPVVVVFWVRGGDEEIFVSRFPETKADEKCGEYVFQRG